MENLKEIMDGKFGYVDCADWLGTKLALTEDAFLDNINYGGEIIAAYMAHAVNSNNENDKTVYLCIWPAKDGYDEPSEYIDWTVCDTVERTNKCIGEVVDE